MFNDIQVPYASKQKLGYVSFKYIVTGKGGGEGSTGFRRQQPQKCQKKEGKKAF